MSRSRRTAGLSLDLDNQWSYMKTHGDPGWEAFPSYLDIVVPRFLRFLRDRDLTITVFVVGQDAAIVENGPVLRSIADAGHEIGNHSFHHEPWLHLYSEAEIEAEIARAEEAILEATGERPTGFRGPGFSFSASTLRVLARRGYAYDASTFPTFLGPLARAYYFFKSGPMTREQKQERSKLFGTFREGLRPLRPYRWTGLDRSLVELPVTTMPFLKTPIHLSYLLYLSVFSKSLALAYWRVAIEACRYSRTPLSLLLHPLDFLGQDDQTGLDFFPAMNLPSERKLALIGEVLAMFCDRFEVKPLSSCAEEAFRRGEPLVPAPAF